MISVALASGASATGSGLRQDDDGHCAAFERDDASTSNIMDWGAPLVGVDAASILFMRGPAMRTGLQKLSSSC